VKGAASMTFYAPLCSSFLLFYCTEAAVVTSIQVNAEHSVRLFHA